MGPVFRVTSHSQLVMSARTEGEAVTHTLVPSRTNVGIVGKAGRGLGV